MDTMSFMMWLLLLIFYLGKVTYLSLIIRVEDRISCICRVANVTLKGLTIGMN